MGGKGGEGIEIVYGVHPVQELMRHRPREAELIFVARGRTGGIGRYVARRRGIPYVVTLHGGVFDVPAEEAQSLTDPTRGTLEWGKVLGWWVGSRRVLDDAAAILCVGLEEQRRALEAASGAVSVSTMTTGDLGQLDWPVEGNIVYNFGPERQGNTTILREGIGIAAPTGTPVRAGSDGTVAYAGPFEGYGPTVILGHGDGFYTLYMYLEEIGVVEGRVVSAGQVVGTVGGSETPEGPHLEFQIRILENDDFAFRFAQTQFDRMTAPVWPILVNHARVRLLLFFLEQGLRAIDAAAVDQGQGIGGQGKVLGIGVIPLTGQIDGRDRVG